MTTVPTWVLAILSIFGAGISVVLTACFCGIAFYTYLLLRMVFSYRSLRRRHS